jgi:hypothetical protein
MKYELRLEQRIQLGQSKLAGFDYLAIVIFDSELEVRSAVVVPYAAVWQIVEARAYRRINFS